MPRIADEEKNSARSISLPIPIQEGGDESALAPEIQELVELMADIAFANFLSAPVTTKGEKQ